MSQREKFFPINFDDENIRYVGEIEVMSSSRTGGGPTLQIHFDITTYDLLQKKKVMVNKVLKKQPSYKKLGRFSSRTEDILFRIMKSKDSHQSLIKKLEDSSISMNPILFEIRIEPILEEIKKIYKITQTTCAFF